MCAIRLAIRNWDAGAHPEAFLLILLATLIVGMLLRRVAVSCVMVYIVAMIAVVEFFAARTGEAATDGLTDESDLPTE